MAEGQANKERGKVELYKMEYEQCVASYRNIHEAIWRIFSYISAISAALLVFGSQYLAADAALVAAMAPLLFWFICIYLPMDRYGNMRSERLADIEDHLNETYQVSLGHFRSFRNRPWFKRVKYRVWAFALLAAALFVYVLGWGVPPRFVKQSGGSKIESKSNLERPSGLPSTPQPEAK